MTRNIPIERFFTEKARRVIVNYPVSSTSFLADQIFSIPHHASEPVDPVPVPDILPEKGNASFRVAVYSDVIPPVLAQIVYSALSLHHHDGPQTELFFLGELREPLTLDDWLQKSRYSHITIRSYDSRTPRNTALAYLQNAHCIFAFSSYSPFNVNEFNPPILTALKTGKQVIAFHSGSSSPITHPRLTVIRTGQNVVRQVSDLLAFYHNDLRMTKTTDSQSPDTQSDAICTHQQRTQNLEELIQNYVFHIDSTMENYQISFSPNTLMRHLRDELTEAVRDIVATEKTSEALEDLNELTRLYYPARILPR